MSINNALLQVRLQIVRLRSYVKCLLKNTVGAGGRNKPTMESFDVQR